MRVCGVRLLGRAYLDAELALALAPLVQPQPLDGGGGAVGEPAAEDVAGGAPPHHVALAEAVRRALQLPVREHLCAPAPRRRRCEPQPPGVDAPDACCMRAAAAERTGTGKTSERAVRIQEPMRRGRTRLHA